MDFRRIVPARLGQSAIGTSNTDVIIASVKLILKTFDIVNTGSNTVLLDVHLVPVAGSVSASNAIFYQYPLQPTGSPIQWTGTHVMNAGDKLVCKGSVAGATITVSGAEVV